MSDVLRELANELGRIVRLAQEGDDEADGTVFAVPLLPNIAAALRSAADENDRLREALRITATELDRWGRGDFHYGNTPQDPTVRDTVARARAILAVPEPCATCGGTGGYVDTGYERRGEEWEPVERAHPCPMCAVPEPTEKAKP